MILVFEAEAICNFFDRKIALFEKALGGVYLYMDIILIWRHRGISLEDIIETGDTRAKLTCDAWNVYISIYFFRHYAFCGFVFASKLLSPK